MRPAVKARFNGTLMVDGRSTCKMHTLPIKSLSENDLGSILIAFKMPVVDGIFKVKKCFTHATEEKIDGIEVGTQRYKTKNITYFE